MKTKWLMIFILLSCKLFNWTFKNMGEKPFINSWCSTNLWKSI